MNRRVFVTGGAGYIGSVTTENLIAQGHEVVVFDNLYQGHRAAVHPQAVFVPGDLAIKAQINAAISEHKPEAVMHFAAYSLVGESMQKPFKYLQENTNNGLNLMEAMCEHGVKKFILSSTANLFDNPSACRSRKTSASSQAARMTKASSSWNARCIGWRRRTG